MISFAVFNRRRTTPGPDVHAGSSDETALLNRSAPMLLFRALIDDSEVTSVANIEVQIPKKLGLTSKQKKELQKSFQKQLVETLKGKHSSAIAKSKLMVVDVRAKSKNEVV
jgi:hypothetical protein